MKDLNGRDFDNIKKSTMISYSYHINYSKTNVSAKKDLLI
jgi:hypothetical protein